MTGVEALQEALVGEHALVHAYGVLGARTSEAATPELYADLRAAHQDHRARRDALTAFVVDGGADPATAAPAYDVPDSWDSPDRIRAAAASLARTATESMAALVAAATGDVRTWALDAMLTSAAREVTFGAPPGTWPGAPELDA
jgi:hypothetical protein